MAINMKKERAAARRWEWLDLVFLFFISIS